MKVRDALAWMDSIAPFDSAEDFDNVGLIIGDPNADVSRVIFTLDVTSEAVDKAVSAGAELIIAHHPLLFNTFNRIDYTSVQGQLLISLLSNKISVIAAHTNWDKAYGGVSDALADAVGLVGSERISNYARIGKLAKPMDDREFCAHIESVLGISPRRYGSSEKPIAALAVAGGAYGEGAMQAVKAGADAFLVGEIHHHEILEALACGLTVYDGGHYHTEMPGVEALYKRYIADASSAGLTAEALMV